MPVTLHANEGPGLTTAEIERWRSVSVAVAVDLDRAIGQIDPAIRPLRPPGQQPPLFGTAVTAWCVPPDFGAVPLAIDTIGPGQVLVIAAGGHPETAMIGEILGGHARRRGAAGMICDGAVRDVAMLAAWDDFSVFTRHITPRGPSSAERGAINGPVVFAGQLIRPGDLVIGDGDGLVVLSPAVVRGRIAEAEARIAREAGWEDSLAGGRSMAETFGLAPVGSAPKAGRSRKRPRRPDVP